jgi:hypothetical protein
MEGWRDVETMVVRVASQWNEIGEVVAGVAELDGTQTRSPFQKSFDKYLGLNFKIDYKRLQFIFESKVIYI